MSLQCLSVYYYPSCFPSPLSAVCSAPHLLIISSLPPSHLQPSPNHQRHGFHSSENGRSGPVSYSSLYPWHRDSLFAKQKNIKLRFQGERLLRDLHVCKQHLPSQATLPGDQELLAGRGCMFLDSCTWHSGCSTWPTTEVQ